GLEAELGGSAAGIAEPPPAAGFPYFVPRKDGGLASDLSPQFRAEADGTSDGQRHTDHTGLEGHDAGSRLAQLAPGNGFGMRQEIRAAGGFGNARRGEQSIHQVADVNGAEPALAARDLEHQSVGDGFQ